MSNTTTVQPDTTVVAKPAIKLGHFTGTFQQFQLHAFWLMVHAGIVRKAAHKIANDYASDFGRLMATNAEFASKVGKQRKKGDGESKITISGGAYIKTSRAMSVIRACQQIDALYMESLLNERLLPKLTADLQDYLAECEEWAAEQTWEPTK